MILGTLLLAATFFSNGPHGGRATALVAAPSDARVLYAGTQAGVLRSNDGGETWLRAAALDDVTILAVDPADPKTVYATAGSSVFKSIDAGATFTRLPLREGIIPTGLLVPEHDLVYVASACQPYFSRGPEVQFHEAAGVFTSTDGGATWSVPSGGDSSTLCVTDMTLDPANEAHLIVKILHNLPRESYDAGATWKTATMATPTTKIVAHPTDPNIRYGITGGYPSGFSVSEDAGVTWTKLEPTGVTGTDYVSLEIDPSTGRLFLGTNQGVFRSGDGGRSWLPISAVPSTRVADVVVEPSTRTIVTGTAFGLYTSEFPYGDSEMLLVADSSTRILRVVVQPGDPKRLFAASSDTDLSPFHGRIFRSINGGLSWEAIENPDPVSRWRMAVDAAGTLFTADFLSKEVYRLPRDGASFERVLQTTDPITDVVADPVRPGIAYVLTSQAVLETRDGGTTWARANWSGPSTRTLTIDPTNPELLYATTTSGGYRVIEGVPFGMAAPNIYGPIVVAPTRPSTLYALFETSPFSGKHLLGRSDNSGERWQITRSPSFDDVILALAADPRDADTVWVATGKRGLLVSRDAGNTWQDANGNLPVRLVFSIAIDDKGRAMHVGTTRGVWTTPRVLGRRRAARK